MKRFFLVLALAALSAGSLSAQNFKASGTGAADLFTVEGESLVTATGDFDKDGVPDLVMAAPGIYSSENFAFYFGLKGGGYQLFRGYQVRLPSDTGITVNDKGVVRIQCNRDGGDTDVFLFRYEKGDFRLIGGKEDRHQSAHYDISYNYLTDKMVRTDGEGKGRKSITSGLMQPPPPMYFGWVPLSYDMLDYITSGDEANEAGEHMTVMGIFRVMQANEMLFWTFCDHEVSYHNPDFVPAGYWTCYDEYLSYGSYNFCSCLDIIPQEDGSYLIELETDYEDRSYESEINEDGSNIDEVLENAEPESSHTRTTWLFKDGQFLNETSVELDAEGNPIPAED